MSYTCIQKKNHSDKPYIFVDRSKKKKKKKRDLCLIG